MQNKKPISLSISPKITNKSDISDYDFAKASQISPYHLFVARRNACKMEVLFLNARASQLQNVIIFVCYLIIIFSIIFAVIGYRSTYVEHFYSLSTSIVESIQSEVHALTSSKLLEAYYYASTFGKMFSDPMAIPLTKESASNITRLFFQSHISSSGDVVWRDIGLPSGELVSIESKIPDSYRLLLLYGNCTRELEGSIIQWETDEEGFNSSYPNHGGDIWAANYQVTKRSWYQLGVLKKSPAWTDLYFGSGFIEGSPMFTCVYPLVNASNGEVYSVISHALWIDSTQRILNDNQPSNYSRFAITTEQNLLIAVTGADSTLDYFDGKIVAKSIQELNDPVWIQVSRDIRFVQGQNFSELFTINGIKLRFTIIQSNLEMAPNLIWNFVSVLCSSDLIGDEDQFTSTSYYVSLSFFLVTIFFFIILSIVVRYFIRSNENRFTSQKPEEEIGHIQSTNIGSSIKELNQISQTYDDNLKISKVIDESINILQTSSDSLYRKNVSQFDSLTNKLSQSILSHNYSSMELYLAILFRSRSQFRNTIIAYETIIKERPISLNLSIEELRGLAISVLCKFNRKYQLFNDEKLVNLLEKIISDISKVEILFLVDSLLLLDQIVFNRVDNLFYDPDIFSMAIILSTLLWHILANERSSKPILIDRIFLREETIKSSMITNMLVLFHDALHDNITSETWELFSVLFYSLLKSLPLYYHFKIFSQFELHKEYYIHSKSNLPPNESVILGNQIIILCSLSFMFHENEQKNKYIEILTQDMENVDCFFDCFHLQYFQHVKSFSDFICGSHNS